MKESTFFSIFWTLTPPQGPGVHTTPDGNSGPSPGSAPSSDAFWAFQVQEGRPELSKWTLKWEAFNQKIELNWMAKNLQPLANQKIHWRSEDGLPNRCVKGKAQDLPLAFLQTTCQDL